MDRGAWWATVQSTTEQLNTGAKEFVQSITAKLDRNPGVPAAQGPLAQRFPA